ncbi:MAG: metal ABC transporter solute-binding protein, Zn/Mn family [Candidatus Zhuqueibacterota bacterium]
MKNQIALPIALLLSLLFSCSKNETSRETDLRLNIVATTGMIADMVKNIGGEAVNVTQLMGPGVDPHLFKASQRDMVKLANADLIFYNGLHLEGKMTDILKKINKWKKTIPVSDGVNPDRLKRPPEFEGQYDPHIWFDVALWADAARFVQRALTEFDARHDSVYQANGDAYIHQLTELHDWTLEQIHSIPENQRVLVTAHDAFGYFGIAYGIGVTGLQGISTVAEYGVNDVTRMVDFIVEKKLPAIFVESSIPARSIEAIIAGCRAKGAHVKIGGTLYSDAMGGPGSDADTYFGMVKFNVNTIVAALK